MFRFTIRDVLWLMVVVGLAVAWSQAERRLADQAFRLMHLRGNWEYVKAAGKEHRGIHILGDAERQRVEIDIEIHPKAIGNE